MRLLTILLTIIFINAAGMAQMMIRYSYDEAGNRIRKEILVSRSAVVSKPDSVKSHSMMVLDRQIKVYPIPTTGLLNVDIMDLSDMDRCEIDIFTLSGVQLLHQKVSQSTTEIDITSYTGGMYLLNVVLNGENSAWKVIKK